MSIFRYIWLFVTGIGFGASLGNMFICFGEGKIDWALTFMASSIGLFIIMGIIGGIIREQ